MDWPLSPRGRIAALLSALALSAASAPAQVPVGGEFQVNTSTSGNQWGPHVASDPQGRFVVVWRRDGLSSGSQQVLARRFDAATVPQGAEFVVNTYTVPQYLGRPEVAFEANGGFIVVFARRDFQPTVPNTLLARRYDAAGAPRGPEFLIATVPSGPHVSAGSGGGFVVTWAESNGSMFAKLYDAAGTPVTTTFMGTGGDPAVSMTPDGGFVVAWAVPTTPYSVWARLFDAAAVPRGAPFPVVSGGTFKSDVRVASDASGNFAVGWYDAGPSAGDDVGPVVRRYAANGTPLTGDVPLSIYTAGLQEGMALAMTASGDLVAAWTSYPSNPYCPPPPIPPCPPPPPEDGSGAGVFGRLLDASGTPIGGEYLVNQYTIGSQEKAAVSMDGANRFVMTWLDSARDGVFARRFSLVEPAALDVDRVAVAGSNGNRVLEPGETVALEPSWRNATSAAVTYPSASAGLTGPPGPVYSLPDAGASYGTIAAGATARCRDQSDCYVGSVSGPRPAAHWDAVLSEELAAGQGVMKPWLVHVGLSFPQDVPVISPYYRFVETVFHNDVMGGCAPGAFCTGFNVPREHMPAFVLQSYQPTFVPPACVAGSELFADVPASSPYCPWIEELARRGVVAGCGGGNYCPTLTISRETMAVYLLATMGVSPPPCGATTLFTDVPASSPFCRWIEELARRAVVGGCGPGTYCPTLPVARDQMSVFLTVTYGLQLYGP